MQTKEQIQDLLKHQYNSANWKAFLSELFTSTELFSRPKQLLGIDAAIASQAVHIGNISITENVSTRNIAVYEVALARNVVLERNRVGLRNLLKTHWKDQDAAFIVYYQADSQHPDAKKWRFSYISELKKINEAGEYVASNTEPKRYTYVLGEGESCRTAAERFYDLQQKANKATLDDVKEAFSVEKLSKTFFADYKDHYQNFVQFLTGKRLEKVGGKWEEQVKQPPNTQLISVFNNDEKDVRDFCKKLLGRIVFLYFIQKKGWLGVPPAGEWGSGKPDFMSRLLANCRNPAIFYSEYLSKLFFETLNQPRKDDLAEIIAGEPTRIPYLNGGLFEEDNPSHRNLVFDGKLFKDLFDFFDQYNFTIYEDDPNDHTVAVDPEMLGHIFENLLEDNKDKGAFYTPKEIVHYMCQESLIEYLVTYFEGEGYTVKTDGFISFHNTAQTSFLSANDDLSQGVNQGIKRQTVLEIPLQWQSPDKVINREIIEKLLKKQLGDADKQAVIEHANHFNKALDTVKICDPAIGSGAFPMGLLQEIFTAKQTLHIFVHGDLATFAPADVKLNIIQNSIYGVDIERGAVDIARLRFWLSLVVDETEPKALPNLDYKIVVGNSLISKLGDDVIDIDWDIKPNNHGLFGVEEAKSIEAILKQISTLQSQFFNANASKKELAPKIRNLKIDLLIQQLNLMIAAPNKEANKVKAKTKFTDGVIKLKADLQTEGWKQQVQALQTLKTQRVKTLEFFDWQLNFAEVMNKHVAKNGKVGFDIVIGNPPYVQLKWLKEDYSKASFSAFTKSSDIYCLFYELATELLKASGTAAFITSNKWLRSQYGVSLKHLLLENSGNLKIINFGGYQIFETATVDTNILIWDKNSSGTNKIGYSECGNIVNLQELKHFLLEDKGADEIWILAGAESKNLKNKIEHNFKKLEDINVEFNYGILTGANKAFIINEAKKNELASGNESINELIVPILRGKDLHKYWFSFNSFYLINTHNGLRKKDLNPVYLDHVKHKKLIDHFESFGADFKARGEKGVNWYSLRSCNFIDLYSRPKILYADIVQDTGKFYFDEKGFFANDTAFMIYSDDVALLKFLTSVLNSKVSAYFYTQFYCGGSLGNNGLRYKKEFLQKLPVPNYSQVVVDVHDEILEFKSANKDTTKLEKQIDHIVYRLYGLSHGEAKSIDSGFALSEAEYAAIEIT